MKTKAIQRTLRVTLNLVNADDAAVQQIADWWKSQRQLLTNVRKAILLFYDLQLGSTDRLRAEFPWTAAALEPKDAALQQRLEVVENYLLEIATNHPQLLEKVG